MPTDMTRGSMDFKIGSTNATSTRVFIIIIIITIIIFYTPDSKDPRG